jgi:hypothetical protein
MQGELVPPGGAEDGLAAREHELQALLRDVVDREMELASMDAAIHEIEAERRAIEIPFQAELAAIDLGIAEALLANRPQDTVLLRRRAEARVRAERSARLAREIDEWMPPRKRTESKELNALYSVAARRFHPEVGSDSVPEQRLRTDYMVLLNGAFSRGDELAIRDLMRGWAAEGISEEAPKADAETRRAWIHRRLSGLHRRLADLATDIRRTREGSSYALHLDAEAARARGEDPFAALIADYRSRIAQGRRRRDGLDGPPPRAP